jgi:hypothetical protein
MNNHQPHDSDGARALILCILLVIFGTMAYFRITNPDMTSMRYALTYWPLYGAFIIGLALYTLLRRGK